MVKRLDQNTNLHQQRGRIEGGRVPKRSTATQQVDSTVEQRGADDVDRIDGRESLPKSFGTNAQSPLTALVQAGWEKMAKLYGSEGQQGALDLQIAVLGGSDPKASPLSNDTTKTLERQFVSLAFSREEATKLVGLLGTVFGGLVDEPGLKKSHRERQIEVEIDKFRRELVDIKKTSFTPERDAKIADLANQLLGVADGFQKRLNGLSSTPAVLGTFENRVRAVFDVVTLLKDHFFPGAAAQA
jgi:hypothetical protein